MYYTCNDEIMPYSYTVDTLIPENEPIKICNIIDIYKCCQYNKKFQKTTLEIKFKIVYF